MPWKKNKSGIICLLGLLACLELSAAELRATAADPRTSATSTSTASTSTTSTASTSTEDTRSANAKSETTVERGEEKPAPSTSTPTSTPTSTSTSTTTSSSRVSTTVAVDDNERTDKREQSGQPSTGSRNTVTPDLRSGESDQRPPASESRSDTGASGSQPRRLRPPVTVPGSQPPRTGNAPPVGQQSQDDSQAAADRARPLREILLTTESVEQAEQQRRDLSQSRVSIISRRNLPGLGFVLSTYRVPDDVDMESLVTDLRDRYPGSEIEQNQRFFPLMSEKRQYAQQMVNVPVPSDCEVPVLLAMLDSGVNARVPALQGASIEIHDMTGQKEMSSQHGTAIATLMLSGHPNFPGLVPGASLLAVNVFAKDANGQEETRSDWLLYGLNLLAARTPAPAAVNMSFGGDYSRLFEKVINRLSSRMVFVAAAGNDGMDRPTYPAAYERVYGIASLDVRGRRSRHSNYGAHVALTAPGEDVWTSGEDGKGFYATGTSFAASFATAALALVNHGGRSPADYIASLGDNRQVDFEGLCRRAKGG